MTVDYDAAHRAMVILNIRQLVAAPKWTPEWVAHAWKTLQDCDDLLSADDNEPTRR